MVIERFHVYLVTLNPTVGSEVSKTRPCVVVSPDEMNRRLSTVIGAPLTSTRKNYPTRVSSKVGGRPGQVMLDQIRTVDRRRLVKKVGELDVATSTAVVRTLLEMFA
jgi:mRNA interferase MazF